MKMPPTMARMMPATPMGWATMHACSPWSLIWHNMPSRHTIVGTVVEKQVVAKHEAGHAIVSTAVQILIPTSAPVEKLSIIPRTGGALG